MTTELDLVRQAKVLRVIELLLSGEAGTVTEACELANVKRPTYYKWRKEGAFDEILAQMKAANVAEVISRFTSSLPELFKKTLDDALDDEATMRDRDQRTRTAVIIYDKIAGLVPEPATGESAPDWLAKHASKFQPVLIQGSTVIIQSDGDVVEGEAEELNGALSED